MEEALGAALRAARPWPRPGRAPGLRPGGRRGLGQGQMEPGRCGKYEERGETRPMQPMRVLDLDMDFFLSGVCALAPEGRRPAGGGGPALDGRGGAPVSGGEVPALRRHPLRGGYSAPTTRRSGYGGSKMEAGRPNAAFHLTHVDAHSDLGIGRPGPAFVLECVLARRPQERADLEGYRAQRKLDEANYLLFALAFRWISALDNVRNPHSRPDMPAQILREGPAGRAQALRLSSSLGRLMPQFDYGEPEVPYRPWRRNPSRRRRPIVWPA